MFYYKKIENEEVIEIGTHSLILPTDAIEITEEEYNTLLAELEEKWKQEEPQNEPQPSNEYMAGYEQALLDLAEVE